MKADTPGFFTPLVIVALLTLPLSLAAQRADAKLISFDVPGAGTAANQGTGCFGCTFAINQAGTIVGSYVDANNVYHGFVRSHQGKLTTFEAPGADTTAQSYNGTTAQSINDLGEITGYYADTTGVAHGFVRSPGGRFTSFDVPGAAYGSIPVFINLEGAVVGYSLDANLLFHAFLRHPDGRISVYVGPNSCTSGTPAGCYGSASTYADLFGRTFGNFADNSGNFVQHGFIRSRTGNFTTFDAPGAGTGVYQGTGCPGCNLGGNFSGAIAGSYTDTNNVFHGFLRSPEGKVTTFDAVGAGTGAYEGTGCFSDCPVGLNDGGVITGSYFDSNYVQHGFLRSPEGHFVTVDPSGSVGTQPESINNAGAIAGYYFDANNVYHGFVRTESE